MLVGDYLEKYNKESGKTLEKNIILTPQNTVHFWSVFFQHFSYAYMCFLKATFES